MGKISVTVAVLTGLCVVIPAAAADSVEVGAMASVQQAVYGAPPQGGQVVKRQGDNVAFQETLETVERGAAVIRFIDDSTLDMGASSKVTIDAFVFDPAKLEGNALIDITVGTLRYVTGGMPKGNTTIKTPTAVLILRGTDVTVHVHPDGTTDTTVSEGTVEAHNALTNGTTNLGSGQSATLATSGNSSFNGTMPPTGTGATGSSGSHSDSSGRQGNGRFLSISSECECFL